MKGSIMTARKLAALLVLIYATVLGGTFMYNLPSWCANQHIGGNSLIHPLCK